MAKILISLLGTGKKAQGDFSNNEYETVDYKIENKIYSNKSLVSTAIIERYNIDKAYFIGTSLSMWDNLCSTFNSEEEYQLEIIEKKENKTLNKIDLLKLENNINNVLKNPGSQCIIINDGENEPDLWDTFNKLLQILEDLEENDEVFFDITHLFRSLSVMTFIMAEFGKISRKFKIAKFFYGKLKVGEPSPIIDLSVFFDLLDWAKAIENLKKYGNSSDLKNLISTSNFPKDLENSFSNFSNALSISDMGAMQGAIKVLKGKVKIFESYESQIVNVVLKDLKEFIQRFSIESLWKFQLELAKWYAENKNYAMCYITLVEAINSKVCTIYSLSETDKYGREEAKKILRSYQNGSKEEKEINRIHYKLNKIRINIAHKVGGSNKSTTISPQKAIETLPKDIRDLEKLLFSK